MAGQGYPARGSMGWWGQGGWYPSGRCPVPVRGQPGYVHPWVHHAGPMLAGATHGPRCRIWSIPRSAHVSDNGTQRQFPLAKMSVCGMSCMRCRRAGVGRSVDQHRRTPSWRGCRLALIDVMRLRERRSARLHQPERGGCPYQGI